MPELADLPTSEGEQAVSNLTGDYVQGVMDEAFKSVGGEVETSKPKEEAAEPDKQETPETPEEETPETPEAEPEKREEKPEAAPELEPEEKRQQTWQKYKAGYKESERLKNEVIPDLQKQLAEFEGTRAERDSLRQQLAEAKTDRETIEHELYKGRVTASRVFQDKVNKPFQNIEAAVQQLAKDNELDGGQFMNLLVAGDKRAFKEFISGLDEFDRNDAHTMFKDMRVVASLRDQLLRDSRAVAEREAQEASQAQTQSLQQALQSRQAAVGEIVPGFTKNILSLLPEDKRPDLHKFSQEVMNIDQWAPHLKMYGGMSALILPELIDNTKALRGQLDEAQKEISKLRKGSPKTGAGSVSSTKDQKEEEKISADTSIEDFAHNITKKIRGSLGLR